MNQFDKKIFINNVKYLLAKKGESFKNLEEKVKVSQGYFSRFINLEKDIYPNIKFLCDVSNYFNINLELLISFDISEIGDNDTLVYKFINKLINDIEIGKLSSGVQNPDLLFLYNEEEIKSLNPFIVKVEMKNNNLYYVLQNNIIGENNLISNNSFYYIAINQDEILFLFEELNINPDGNYYLEESYYHLYQFNKKTKKNMKICTVSNYYKQEIYWLMNKLISVINKKNDDLYLSKPTLTMINNFLN